MIPCFSLSALTLRFTMADIAEAVVAGVAPGVSFTDVEMVCMLTELSPGAQNLWWTVRLVDATIFSLLRGRTAAALSLLA
jgi:hypothetical protein